MKNSKLVILIVLALKANLSIAVRRIYLYFMILIYLVHDINELSPCLRRLESTKDVADIKLSQHLDYESNTIYTLIVRVQNKYQLAAETVIDIEVLDVNDNIPVFREMKKGSVLENEPPGVPVMQVRAIDADGTSAHNQVRLLFHLRDAKLHINCIIIQMKLKVVLKSNLTLPVFVFVHL